MGFIDTLIYGYRTLKNAGTAVTQRNTINFGSGLTATDNATTGETDVTSSAGAAPTGTGVVSTTAGAFNAAASAVVSINEAGQELDVVTAAQSTLLRLTNYAGASANGANIIVNKARGTLASPTKALSGDQLGGFSARGYHEDGTPGFGPSAASAFRFVASQDQLAAAQGAYLSILTVLDGTSSARESIRVAPGVISIFNQAATFKFLLTAPAIAADRTINLPLLTGTDTLVCEAFAATLTNKSMSGASNTFTSISLTTAVTGTLPVANGGTGVTSSTGSGANVLGTSPTITTPTITATAVTDATSGGTINNCTLGSSAGSLRRLRFTAASGPTVTGFDATGVAEGTILRVLAVAGVVAITHEGAGSTAANRCTLQGGTTINIAIGCFTQFEYDATSSRWRHMAATAI